MKVIRPPQLPMEQYQALALEQLTQLLKNGMPKHGITISIKPEDTVFNGKPKICKVLFSMLAYTKQTWLTTHALGEVACHGVVTRLDETTFYIEDILVYPQIVESVHVASDDEKYPIWLMTQSDEVFNKLRYQYHSHVNMGVTPSSIDDTYYAEMLKDIRDFYIFAIGNKRGELNFMIYDVVANIFYESKDIIWDIYIDESENQCISSWLTKTDSMCAKPEPVTRVSPVYSNPEYPAYKFEEREPYTQRTRTYGECREEARQVFDKPYSTSGAKKRKSNEKKERPVETLRLLDMTDREYAEYYRAQFERGLD